MVLFFLILVLGFVLQLFLPWWVSGLVPLVLAFALGKRPGLAFVAGFAGIGLGWLAYSLFFHIRNEGILAARLAVLLHLPQPWLLLLLGLLAGGLVGGAASLAGVYSRRLL